jgi:hypothetical protein
MYSTVARRSFPDEGLLGAVLSGGLPKRWPRGVHAGTGVLLRGLLLEKALAGALHCLSMRLHHHRYPPPLTTQVKAMSR